MAEQGEPQGILLYYKYVDLDTEQQCVAEFYEKVCCEHNLRGRVRVAKDGVNVTVRSQGIGLRQAAAQRHELPRHIPIPGVRISN